MNRLFTGAIAGAAGIALLLGGGGTYALWNSTATASAGVVTSGTLSIATSGTPGTWTSTSANGTETVIPTEQLAAHPIVPGDTLTFRQGIDVVASGNDLTAILRIDTSTVSYDNAALATELRENTTIALPNAPAFVHQVDQYSFRIAGASGSTPLTIVATLHFPAGAPGDNSTQGGSLNLSNLSVKLQQIVE